MLLNLGHNDVIEERQLDIRGCKVVFKVETPEVGHEKIMSGAIQCARLVQVPLSEGRKWKMILIL